MPMAPPGEVRAHVGEALGEGFHDLGGGHRSRQPRWSQRFHLRVLRRRRRRTDLAVAGTAAETVTLSSPVMSRLTLSRSVIVAGDSVVTRLSGGEGVAEAVLAEEGEPDDYSSPTLTAAEERLLAV